MKRRGFIGALGSGLAALALPRTLNASLRAWSRPAMLPGARHFVERWSWAMGQPVHLQLFAESESQGYDAAAAALAELRRVESRLTLFDDASDLSELNRHAGRSARRYDHDLTAIVRGAVALGRETDGAFNCAIEPLMRAWGFRAPRRTEPSRREILEARRAVEAARIVMQGDRIGLPFGETRLDLGGIGVGYGLDRAALVLRGRGISSAFLDVSGDCLAIGAPPDRPEGWLVEIANPAAPGRFLATTHLRDAALATSSNQVSVVRYGRSLRGHVMDPHTGWPADRLIQVSVVAGTGMEADGLSTAMLVSGRASAGVVRYYQA
jgi:FAD:protein FMN transferase